MHKRFQLIFRFLPKWPFLVALLIGIVALWQHQAIHDWLSLRTYDPPSSVVQLADDIQLTGQSRRLFYINHPALDDRQTFKTACSSRGEHTIVLGCYHPVDRGIYIFHVTDDRLNGVDQVTAAHELLHAAYDRLSSPEKARVNRMLQGYYDSGLYDDRIKTIVATYQKTEPNDVINEMHSIFGTEVAILPADLESYYKQYFMDRGKVVGYANAYQAEFTSRQKQVTDYDAQLKDMKQQIDDNTDALDRQEAQINNLRARLDNDRNSGNIEAYNANVPLYNARIDAYNSLISSTKTLIAGYNDTVSTRNNLALQVAELAHSIDSSFQPIDQ